MGLETHLFDGTLIAAAHKSMEEIMRIVGQPLTFPGPSVTFGVGIAVIALPWLAFSIYSAGRT